MPVMDIEIEKTAKRLLLFQTNRPGLGRSRLHLDTHQGERAEDIDPELQLLRPRKIPKRLFVSPEKEGERPRGKLLRSRDIERERKEGRGARAQTPQKGGVTTITAFQQITP